MFTRYARGMVYWADIPKYENNPNVQAGMRPCIIVSNDVGNQFSKVVTVVPCTTNTERNPDQATHLILRLGREEDSLVLCENIMTISKDLLKGFMGMLSSDLLKELNQALSAALGLIEIPEPKINFIERPNDSEPKITKKYLDEPELDHKKINNRGQRVSDLSEMQDFLDYAENHTKAEVMSKYRIPTEIAVSQRIIYYRKRLGMDYKVYSRKEN